MKVKELNTLANIAWSPGSVHPGQLACGTTAKQVDAGLTSVATLALYNLDLLDHSLELKPAASVEAPARFHALEWSGVGNEVSGLIYGGCENGGLYIYDAEKLLSNASESQVGTTLGRHSGPIFTLSSNHLKANFVACGSSDSEVTVWDVSNLAAPIIPGKKLSLGADVSCVEFNRQVEHIFSSTCGGHAVVWDLRKQASIMTISDTVSRMKASSMTWHPCVATQLLLASEEDATPWAQVWDLRYATAPLRTLEGHQRGIMKALWCTADPNLLITSAKDNKIIVWNPNETQRGEELVGEFPSYNQWSFDLDWCRRDPSLVATASVDSCVSVFSLLGAGQPPTQSDKFSQIADSFPGMEMPSVVPQGATPQPIRLKNPPKWLYPISGASFAFGGRLVKWNNQSRSVEVSQVVTEQCLVDRSSKLEEALSQPQFASYCQNKAKEAVHPRDQMLWQFISANFEDSPRTRYMELLGFSGTQASSQLQSPTPPQDAQGVTAEDLADKMNNLATNEGSTGSLDPSDQFEMIAAGQSFNKTPEPEPADGVNEKGEDEKVEEENVQKVVSLDISEAESEGTHRGLLIKALLVGDLESAVDLCLADNLYPHALALSAHANSDLFAKTRDKVLQGMEDGLGSLIGALVRGDLATITSNCKLDNWKEALTAVLTHAAESQFPELAEKLGERLEDGGGEDAMVSAMLCYVCAGSLEKFVSCWLKINPNTANPADLQDLIEIVMGLHRSLGASGRATSLSDGITVSSLLCQYASLLAAQGALNTAVSYLNAATQGEMVELRNRLYRALGYNVGATVPQPAAAPVRQNPTPAATSQPQPSQFTPSVQDQQRTIYGDPASVQSPTFFTPTAQTPQMGGMVPQYGGPPVPMTPLTPVQPAPPPMAPPPTEPPTQPVMSGGFRRGGASRYIHDHSSSNTTMFNPTLPPHPASYPAPPTGPSLNLPSQTPPQFFTPTGTSAPPPVNMDQQQQHSTSLPPAKPPAALDSTVPRGWNDPPFPTVRKVRQQQKQQQQQPQEQAAQEVKVPEPIMCPVPGGSAPDPPQQFMGFQQPQYGSVATTGPAAATLPEPASKGPLPPEHQVIEDVLTELNNRCLSVVQNQQMKQRLEHIGTKLEVLYDKLRAGQLGSTSLSGVHGIINAARTGDYHAALAVHAQTIAKGSFSELSSFMPSIKLLLQYCMQIQVFLQ